MRGAPPPGRSRSKSCLLGSVSTIFNWPARDPGGGKLTLCSGLVGWLVGQRWTPLAQS